MKIMFKLQNFNAEARGYMRMINDRNLKIINVIAWSLLISFIVLFRITNNSLLLGTRGFFDSLPLNDKMSSLLFTFTTIVSLYFLAIIHEIIHLITSGEALFSEKNYLVIRFMNISVFTDKEISRNRLLILLISPFILTQLLLILLLIFQQNITILYFSWLAFYMNFVISFSDIFVFFYVVFKTPKTSVFLGNYIKTKSDGGEIYN
jgi:hypothetical protein